MGYLEHVFHASEERNRQDILRTMRPIDGGSLLDLGCANGVFTRRVAQACGAGEIHGIEFLEAWAAEARANGVDAVVADLAERLPYDDATFDAVHSNQVIEHLQKTDHFMREIHRVLKPGGYAVISTNNLSSWHNVAMLLLGWQPAPCHVSDEIVVGNPINYQEGDEHIPCQAHLRIFTHGSLAGLGAHHGLVPEVQIGSGYYPLPPRLAAPLARADRRHAAFLIHRFARPTAPVPAGVA
jgi:SAM-dependent methyltransferase